MTTLSRRILLRTSARLAAVGATASSLALLGGCQLVNLLASPPAGMRRIGYIYAGSRAFNRPYAAAFLDRLRKLGWVEDENLTIEWRFAEGRNELVPEMAVELARLPVELILSAAAGPEVLQPETSALPIVEPFIRDPHAYGVASLARPGGNVTGLVSLPAALYTKSIELLKTILPNLGRLAVVGDHSPVSAASTDEPATQTAAEALGINTLSLDVRRTEDVEASLVTAQTWSAEALLIFSQTSYTAGVYARIAELAAVNHVPAMFAFGPAVTDDGALMSFAADLLEAYRRGAEYVDKILRGARPADLPVEEAREFQFIVNVNAAKALGLTFPPDAAAQVTQWVQ
jgi:putative ABC transport system substrate-binding protein